jgi:hypothetical protein
MSPLPSVNHPNVGHTCVCVCTHSAPGPPKSRRLAAIRPLIPATLRRVDPLKAHLGSTSPLNLSALRWYSAYNTNLGYQREI